MSTLSLVLWMEGRGGSCFVLFVSFHPDGALPPPAAFFSFMPSPPLPPPECVRVFPGWKWRGEEGGRRRGGNGGGGGGREGGDDPDPQTKEAGEEEIGLPSIDTRVLNLQIRTGNISRELEMLSNEASNLRVTIDDLEQNPVDPACLLFLWLATVPPPPPPPRHTDGGAARPSAPAAAAAAAAHRKSDGRRPRLLSPFFLFFLLSLLPEAPAGEEPTSEDYSCESPKISCRRYQKCE